MQKRLIVVFAAVALAGCTSTFERAGAPPGRPPAGVGTAAAGATLPRNTCIWAGEASSHGGMSCRQGQLYRCNDGAWQQTALGC